jgi:hypothetical protein
MLEDDPSKTRRTNQVRRAKKIRENLVSATSVVTLTILCGTVRRRLESTGQTKQNTDAGTKMLKSKEDPLDFLLPDSGIEKSGVNTVRIQDKGSKPKEVLADIQLLGCSSYWVDRQRCIHCDYGSRALQEGSCSSTPEEVRIQET